MAATYGAARSGDVGIHLPRHRRLARRCAGSQCIIRLVHLVVMGSGGVGGYFGAKLLRAGVEVTMVARGPHLAAMRRSGLTIRSAVDGESVVRPAVVERLEGVPPAD